MRFDRTSPVPPLVLAAALALAGCSKDKGTNPTATPKELNSGSLAPGEQYAHRFFAADLFPYHCAFHPAMTGTVEVSDAAPAGDTLVTVDIPGADFSPVSVTIHTGGKVTWINNDGTAHTVTSN